MITEFSTIKYCELTEAHPTIVKMPVLRKFFGFELEAAALFIGYFGNFACLLSALVALESFFDGSIQLQQDEVVGCLAHSLIYDFLVVGTILKNTEFLILWLI